MGPTAIMPAAVRIRPLSGAEPAPKGGRDVVRQRVVGAATRRGYRLLGPRALPATRLPQRPDEHRRAAGRTTVEIRHPVVALLAVGADQHLLVRDDPALPRARTLAGIGLPGAAVVAGHRSRPRGRPTPSGSRRGCARPAARCAPPTARRRSGR